MAPMVEKVPFLVRDGKKKNSPYKKKEKRKSQIKISKIVKLVI